MSYLNAGIGFICGTSAMLTGACVLRSVRNKNWWDAVTWALGTAILVLLSVFAFSSAAAAQERMRLPSGGSILWPPPAIVAAVERDLRNGRELPPIVYLPASRVAEDCGEPALGCSVQPNSYAKILLAARGRDYRDRIIIRKGLSAKTRALVLVHELSHAWYSWRHP